MPIILFFVSGFTALLYEIVWTRQLILVFGATVPSTSVILAGFMAGMALGSWAGGRLARRCRRPLALYGWLELGIAAWALALPWALRAITAFYETTSLPPESTRLILTFAALLPATTLMGATFPVLGQTCAGPDAGNRLARLYAANLMGACLGVLATAFVLLAFIGLSWAHRLGIALNMTAGLAALAWPAPECGAPIGDAGAQPPWKARAAVFSSGLCAMAFEVIWTRLLTPSFNNSAYGFASILFVFLLMLGLGSLAVSRMKAMEWETVAFLQILAGLLAYVGYRFFELTQLAQIRFDLMAASTISPVIGAPLLEALAVVGPMAFLQGMVRPAALRPCAREAGPGAAAGTLALWNTLGGIAGAVAAGFWWIPRFGVQNALLASIGLGAASGAALASWCCPRWPRRAAYPLACAAILAWMTSSLQGSSIPRNVLLDWLNRGDAETTLPFYSDDIEASVAVADRGGADRRLIINGVGVTGFSNATKMMAHIPLSLHRDPQRTLVICFGMGTTFRSAQSHGVRVDAVDLVPSVFAAFPLFFSDARRSLAGPGARLLVNDGRNHLLRERTGYDVIIVDPSPPLYAAGTVNLYSKDFFTLARRRLRPDGLLAVWLLEWPETEFKMVLRSFLASMPHAQVWRVTDKEEGGVVLLGSNEPIIVDRRLVRARLRKPAVREDLLEIDGEFASEEAFWRLFMGAGGRYAGYVSDAPEVTDDFPRIEYPYFRSRRSAYRKHPDILRWRPDPVPAKS
ncbi:MAG: fused MFS/spermidine synthase [Elusimicrobia bacterium]|nr:fused MFS/spermidine synthase [Elusimicrobiota bacterium]